MLNFKVYNIIMAKAVLYVILAVVIIFGLYFAFVRKNRVISPSPAVQNSTSAPAQADVKANTTAKSQPENAITPPINDALSRITKKPFGIKISPTNSPVSPEKFSGFHTGVDFETPPDEPNVDVPIFAVCNGPLLLKKWATGYGGVAVQKCVIAKMDVTVIYGHLKLAGISTAVGEQLADGQQIGILGKGYGTETDGERKHLHLGIHKGTTINILGYVKSQSDLSQWLDASAYLTN